MSIALKTNFKTYNLRNNKHFSPKIINNNRKAFTARNDFQQNSSHLSISFTGGFNRIAKLVSNKARAEQPKVEGSVKNGLRKFVNLFRRRSLESKFSVLEKPLITAVTYDDLKTLDGTYKAMMGLPANIRHLPEGFKQGQLLPGDALSVMRDRIAEEPHIRLRNMHNQILNRYEGYTKQTPYTQKLEIAGHQPSFQGRGEDPYAAFGHSGYGDNFGYRNFDKQALGSNPVDGAGNHLGEHHGDPSGLLSENNMLESGFEQLDSHAGNIDGLASSEHLEAFDHGGAGLDEFAGHADVAGPSTSGVEELAPHDTQGLEMPELPDVGEMLELPEIPEMPDIDIDVTDLL